MNQTKQILEYLKEGHTISPAEALIRCGCFRLAARINDLRNQGHEIKSEMRKDTNGKRYARYSLVSEA
jgi:hypothetical protein